jgi:small-conductance mechanosensitive channel
MYRYATLSCSQPYNRFPDTDRTAGIAPEVFVSDLGQSSVTIRTRVWFPSVWANTQDDVSLRTAIIPQLKAALKKAGIEVPFPQQEVWFGNAPPPAGAEGSVHKKA